MDNGTNIVILPRFLVIPFIISMSVLVIFFTFVEGALTPFYYIIMIVIVGWGISRNQLAFSAYLQKIPLPAFLRFMILGYMAVLLEETIVGTIYTLQEGFSLLILFQRIQQFVLFNIFAFTGFLLGAYVMSRHISIKPIDFFLIAGSWGLFAEKIIFLIFSFPIAAIALILPTMAVYSVILSPAFLSLKSEERGQKIWPFWKKFVFTLLVMLFFSVLPVGLLMHLRLIYPLYFPACEYIPCES